MWIIVIFARYMYYNNNNKCFTRQQNRRNCHV